MRRGIDAASRDRVVLAFARAMESVTFDDVWNLLVEAQDSRFALVLACHQRRWGGSRRRGRGARR